MDLMLLAFVILAFLVVFPLFWMGVIYLISFISGWQSMAKKYRSKYFPATYKSGQSATMGFQGNYNHVLNIAVQEEGVYLGVMFLFRAGHPNLFIPWSEIRLEKESNHFFFGNYYKLSIGNPRICRITMSAKVFEAYKQYLR